MKVGLGMVRDRKRVLGLPVEPTGQLRMGDSALVVGWPSLGTDAFDVLISQVIENVRTKLFSLFCCGFAYLYVFLI